MTIPALILRAWVALVILRTESALTLVHKQVPVIIRPGNEVIQDVNSEPLIFRVTNNIRMVERVQPLLFRAHISTWVWLPAGWDLWDIPYKASGVDYDIIWGPPPEGWVTSWNGREWAVTPQSWDYAIADITWLVSALWGKEWVITGGTASQYWRGDKTWQTLDKSAVGLWNVDNTSDANKPVSIAQATADALAIPLTQKGASLWVATLDSGWKIVSSQLPALTISEYLWVFSNTTLALANAGVQASQRGDWFTVNTNWGETWIVTTDSPTTLSHVTKVATPTDTVLSVTSNSSLTTSPTTGNVVIGINLANSNVFTVFQTVLKTSLWVTTVPGWIADNTTSATGSVMQASPSFLRRGRGYLTNSSTSVPFEIQDYAIGMANTGAYWKWKVQWRGNSGTWADFLEYDSDPVWNGFSFTPSSAQSNAQPGTTRIQTINNTGSNSWTDYKFSWTRQVSVGADSSWGYNIFVKGGNYLSVYDWNNNQLFMYAYPTALVHSTWHGSFSAWVNAGSSSNTAPPSKLTSYWRIWGKTVYIEQNTTLTDNYYVIVANGDNNNICTGTPTYACGHWTNEWDCNAVDHHWACSWFPGNDCSAFNNESWMGTCSGTGGCSAQTAGCAWPGNETDCTNQNNTYGGSCAWVDASPSCVGFDYWTCSGTAGCTVNNWTCSNNYTPCSANYWDCTPYSDGGGDGSACSGYNAGCSYDSGTGACTGTPFLSCSGWGACTGYGDEGTCLWNQYWSSCSGWENCSMQGDESTCTSYSYYNGCTGNYSSYSCINSYYTGICTGTYWAVCTGTSNCTSIAYGNCTSEAGCSQSSGLTLTFPTEWAYWTAFYAGYKIYNKGSSATITMNPNTDQSIVGTATIAPWVRRVYDFAWLTQSCSTYSGTDSTTCITGHTGCSWNWCSGRDEMSCTWTCSWNWSSCDGTWECEGTWTPVRWWIEF